MGSDFKIDKGILKRYMGSDSIVKIPDGVTRIEGWAFAGCKSLKHITIPESVTSIGEWAFYECKSLTHITIPKSVEELGYKRDIWFGEQTIIDKCPSLKECVVYYNPKCIYSSIGRYVTNVIVPSGVTSIGDHAFSECKNIKSFIIPKGVKRIGRSAFEGCQSLEEIIIPDSVTFIGKYAFRNCDHITVICCKNSIVYRYCKENHLMYVFDYEYRDFGGILPPGIERIPSPFEADEEKPFIFVSYSHKDRDTVFEIIKELYETGWKLWYDQGLTIGKEYDLTIKEHIKNCSAFLLFVTRNTINSNYIRTHEIPWAKEYGKPIIKRILDERTDYEIESDSLITSVFPSNMESDFITIKGLTKGNKRKATGISVAFNPSYRGDNFAYCIYSNDSYADHIKTVLNKARANGCHVYDAVEKGEDIDKLEGCSSLIVFLDKSFLLVERFVKLLADTYNSKKDVIIYSLEECVLPKELNKLANIHWLNSEKPYFDRNNELAKHLQDLGCRDSSILIGFDYKETDEGIVITRYTDKSATPMLDGKYNGVPVVKIDSRAFENCYYIKEFSIPNNITCIGEYAFYGCENLFKITIPQSVTSIEERAFAKCKLLESVVIPHGVTELGSYVFEGCSSLTKIFIPESVHSIGNHDVWIDFNKNNHQYGDAFPPNLIKYTYHAFSDSPKLTIYGEKGSFANKYALKWRIPFKAI